MHSQTYIIDYFNLLGDFRECYYLKQNIDFHSVKNETLYDDTYKFFELFFTYYIKLTNINPNSQFIFVMKKISKYDIVLSDILQKYRNLQIKFVIVKDRYNNELVEQNKDDYICQYLLLVHNESILISNDKYKNKLEYTNLFLEQRQINIQIMMFSTDLNIFNTFYIINHEITNSMNCTDYIRNTLQKNKFNTIC